MRYRTPRVEPSSDGPDSRANPVETLRGNEAIIVEIQPFCARLHAGAYARRQTFRASDFAIEQAKARAEEFLRSERRPPLPDDFGPMLRAKRIDAEDRAVAHIADCLETATAEPTFREIDQHHTARRMRARFISAIRLVTGSLRQSRYSCSAGNGANVSS